MPATSPPPTRGSRLNELGAYLALFRPWWSRLGLSAALLAISALVPASAVLLLQRTLDAILGDQQPQHLGLLCAGFAGLYVLGGLLRLARTALTKGIAWRVSSDLRRALHSHLLRLSPAQQADTGSRLSALGHEVDEVQYGVSALITALRNPLSLLGLLGTAAWMAPGLAAWAGLMLLAVALPTLWTGRALRRASRRSRLARARLMSLAQEQLLGLATVQSHQAQDQESARFGAREERDRQARLRLELVRVLPGVITQAVAACAVGLLLWMGGSQVAAGSLAPGALVGFIVALGLMSRPLTGLSEVNGLLQRSLAALEQVQRTLATAPAVCDPASSLPLPAGPLGLVWRDVQLDYGDGPVLRGFNLEVPAGALVVLVGPSGGGKSSALRLVHRALDPDAGEVLLGGHDVRGYRLADLRRAVAVVRQDDVLFARSVAENLSFGSAEPSPHALRAAAQAAGADRFIDALPQGYDTPLGELAGRLSGGERQRLCLARALLRDPELLLLDEATNQIDASTEADILRRLRAARQGRTTVMVAHDLGVARLADQVVVIAEGQVRERGGHDQLLRAGGLYARLWAHRDAA